MGDRQGGMRPHARGRGHQRAFSTGRPSTSMRDVQLEELDELDPMMAPALSQAAFNYSHNKANPTVVPASSASYPRPSALAQPPRPASSRESPPITQVSSAPLPRLYGINNPHNQQNGHVHFREPITCLLRNETEVRFGSHRPRCTCPSRADRPSRDSTTSHSTRNLDAEQEARRVIEYMNGPLFRSGGPRSHPGQDEDDYQDLTAEARRAASDRRERRRKNVAISVKFGDMNLE